MSMISVEEATEIILSTLYKPESLIVPLDKAVGTYLAETVAADRDFPPFDRASMDGIAISAKVYGAGERKFTIDDIQPAGVPRKKLAGGAHCLEIMTGAMVPEGADLVVRYEEVEVSDGIATVLSEECYQGQNIHHKGVDVHQGDVLALPGTYLAPAEIALLASVGKSQVKVRRFPRAAVVSTGDELVDISETPERHQIRRSNSYALAAAFAQMGVAADIFHTPDQEERLRSDLERIIAGHELIVLTGGVSRGKFDFVPAILEELGVRKHFHGVAQRPGKPFWFGSTPAGKTFFALPGNPVSTYMCFYRYIHPWLRKSMGGVIRPLTACLSDDYSFMPPVTCFLQVKIGINGGKLVAEPVPGGGSGDFANLGQVDGFLELPPGPTLFRAGDVFPFIPFRLLE